MGKALYRKYRSRSLDEVVGQKHITDTLGNAIKSGRFAHAYLLTGPRGTGKTSVARILAHEINNLEYSENSHLDIIEIDAASNNGVEDVRSLREKIMSAPSSAKYKVYIIDEVHMLSKPAFNALLKTLEEPPEHAVFILATTEVHKLPETIISRTQHFNFRPVPHKDVVGHLKHIVKSEGFKIDDAAIDLIADHGEGSFRDSISLLDQASSLGSSVSVEMVEQLLGRAPRSMIESLVHHIRDKDAPRIATTLRELYDQGFEASSIAMQLGRYIREKLGQPDAVLPDDVAIDILRDLIDVPPSHQPPQLLELVLLKRAIIADKPNISMPAEPAAVPENMTIKSVPTESPKEPIVTNDSGAAKDTVPPKVPTEQVQADSTANTPISKEPDPIEAQDAVTLWDDVLQTIKRSHNTLYGIARMAKPLIDDDTLTLTTKFPFHQKRLSESKNSTILANCITEKRGRKTAVICVLADTTANKSVDELPSPMANPDVSAISNIFGGAELL